MFLKVSVRTASPEVGGMPCLAGGRLCVSRGPVNGKLCPTDSGTFQNQKSCQLLRDSDQDMIDESCI